jgi:hypothetical protein
MESAEGAEECHKNTVRYSASRTALEALTRESTCWIQHSNNGPRLLEDLDFKTQFSYCLRRSNLPLHLSSFGGRRAEDRTVSGTTYAPYSKEASCGMTFTPSSVKTYCLRGGHRQHGDLIALLSLIKDGKNHKQRTFEHVQLISYFFMRVTYKTVSAEKNGIPLFTHRLPGLTH